VPINIKDPDTDRVARELARETGETITLAIRNAVCERLDNIRNRKIIVPNSDNLEAIISRGRVRRNLTDESAETILGYNPDGLFS